MAKRLISLVTIWCAFALIAGSSIVRPATATTSVCTSAATEQPQIPADVCLRTTWNCLCCLGSKPTTCLCVSPPNPGCNTKYQEQSGDFFQDCCSPEDSSSNLCRTHQPHWDKCFTATNCYGPGSDTNQCTVPEQHCSPVTTPVNYYQWTWHRSQVVCHTDICETSDSNPCP